MFLLYHFHVWLCSMNCIRERASGDTISPNLKHTRKQYFPYIGSVSVHVKTSGQSSIDYDAFNFWKSAFSSFSGFWALRFCLRGRNESNGAAFRFNIVIVWAVTLSLCYKPGLHGQIVSNKNLCFESSDTELRSDIRLQKMFTSSNDVMKVHFHRTRV